MGLFKWLFNREAYDREEREKKAERRNKVLLWLRSGPVIISTTRTFHKAEYVPRDSYESEWGNRELVTALCPNKDVMYHPNSSFTKGGNPSAKTVFLAYESGASPCRLCYANELGLPDWVLVYQELKAANKAPTKPPEIKEDPF
jgi:hypothetical protein